MNYDELIKTISEILENENIYKNGLTLVYSLSEENHKRMDEHLYYKSNPNNNDFVHRDEVEIEIGGILVKLVKKK